MKASLLPDRRIVRFAGEGARAFLNDLFTSEMTTLPAGEWRYCALLTPQGKLIVDVLVMFAAGAEEVCHIDVPASQLQPFLARMKLYDLRSRYRLQDLSAQFAIMAVWDGTAAVPAEHPGGADPRLPALGQRIMLPPDAAAGVAAALGADLVAADVYEAHRVALGVPRGDLDFKYGDAFPHEADIDQFHGIDFKKGCFVGQEVVQRMERRHAARTRIVPVSFAGAPPMTGTAVTADGRTLGTIGSAVAGHALAVLRLDRVSAALQDGHALKADEVTLRLVRPDWVRFAFPGDAGPAP